jgi:hypothetical protein
LHGFEPTGTKPPEDQKIQNLKKDQDSKLAIIMAIESVVAPSLASMADVSSFLSAAATAPVASLMTIPAAPAVPAVASIAAAAATTKEIVGQQHILQHHHSQNWPVDDLSTYKHNH